MPKKPEVTKIAPRNVQRGAVIWINGGEEVVRAVSVVLHMANGADVPLAEDAEVEVLAEQPVTNMLASPEDEGE